MFPTDKNLAAQLAPSFHENMSSEKSHISYIFIITFLFFLKHFADPCVSLQYSFHIFLLVELMQRSNGGGTLYNSLLLSESTRRGGLRYRILWHEWNFSMNHRPTAANRRVTIDGWNIRWEKTWAAHRVWPSMDGSMRLSTFCALRMKKSHEISIDFERFKTLSFKITFRLIDHFYGKFVL